MGKCLSKGKQSETKLTDSEASHRAKNRADFSRKQSNYSAKQGSVMQGVHELKNCYKIEERQVVLGSGAFGKVFLSQSQKDPNFYVAIKVLDKDKMQCDIDLLASEVAVLNKLDHPNIVKYYETYNDYKYIYLVMEFVKGKVLFKHLSEQNDHSE